MKKKFRLFPLLTALILLVGIVPQFADAASFSDVPSGAWFARHITSLSAKNILHGTGGGKFSPYKSITRAEIVAMMAKTILTASEIQQFKGSSSFSDVSAGMWFTPYINWAYAANIVEGDGNGIFRPNSAVTRQELAKMIVNFSNVYGYSLPATQSAKTFTDQNRIDTWARDSVSQCQKSGIIEGDNGAFRPKDTAIRAEAAAMYDRFYTNKRNKDYTVMVKRINGITIKAVQFSLTKYPAGIRTANNKIYGSESMSSMLSNTGAKFAVNAAYFDMNSYSPNTSIVSGGRIVTIDNNEPRTAFVMNTNRSAAFTKNFKVNQSVKNNRTQQTMSQVSIHKKPTTSGDTTRIIFGDTWGTSVGFSTQRSIVIDKNNSVTAVNEYNANISIPAGGYVICQQTKRNSGDYDTFFVNTKVGDTITRVLEYPGAPFQNIQTAIAAGPSLVVNSTPGSSFTGEGIYASDILSGINRKVAIGTRDNGNTVILMTAYCNLKQLANAAAGIGCQNAMNLDGGGSAGIYYDGNWLVSPDRLLNNIIYFK